MAPWSEDHDWPLIICCDARFGWAWAGRFNDLGATVTHSSPANADEVTDEMLVAAMRAFELMSSVLRYREKDKWHTCDMVGMRNAISAALSVAPQARIRAQQMGEPVAWMHSEHIDAYLAKIPGGIAWASPEQTEFYDVALYIAPAQQMPDLRLQKYRDLLEACADALAGSEYASDQRLSEEVSLALTSPERRSGKLGCRRCLGWGTIRLGNMDRETCELCHGSGTDPDQSELTSPKRGQP